MGIMETDDDRPKVMMTRQVHDEAIQLLKDKCHVDMWPEEDVIPRDVLLTKVQGVHAIFCTISDVIDQEVLDAAGPQLKIVATMSVGTNHISTLACKKRGIIVANTPDVAADSAAELTCTLLLTTARRTFEGVEAVQNGQWGKWKPMWLCGTEMSNRTLGIMGFGRVGFGVARRMKPFGLKQIIYHDIHRQAMADDLNAKWVEFETLLEESDFLVISCALTGGTKNLFNKATLAKMKKSAILINTSRGQIVNTADITEALQSGVIHAAGLDITDPEPLPPDHPLVTMDNCVVLPHMGTATTEARLNMAINTARNILATLRRG